MSTTETTPTETPAEGDEATTPPEGGAEPTTKGFDDVIGVLDEADRKVILERLSKPNNEARQLRERLKALEPKAAEFDKLADERKTELEKAQEAATKAQDQIHSLRQQAVASKIEAIAAPAFADPSDAALFIGSDFLADDGSVDEDGIKTALSDLLQKKPHLGRSTEPGMPSPNPAQGGSGGGPAGASQLTKADVERLARDGKHSEIEKARQEGRLDNLLAGK